MTYTSLARPTIVLLAAAAFAACHSNPPTTTATAPTPAPRATAPAANAAATRPSNAMPAGVTAAMIATGDSIFHAKGCVNCHGADAKGAKNGPDLTTPKHLQVDGSYNDFVRIITDGVPADAIKDKTAHTVPMRARGGRPPLLTDEQIKSVAAYVYSLSHK